MALLVPQQNCIELKDSSVKCLPLKFLSPNTDPRSALAIEMRLCRQLLDQNRRSFEAYGIEAICQDREDGKGAQIQLQTHDYVGSFPLKSPTSGRWDYGVIIEPRQGWSDFGCMLSSMGWKVVPELQRMPPLPLSAREIPSWVLASVIIMRIELMLKDVARKYEPRREILRTPRGRIDWGRYASVQVPSLRLLDIPCEFSELSDHRVLLGVVHHTVKKVYDELVGLVNDSAVVPGLLDRAKKILQRVAPYMPVRPTPQMFEACFYGKKVARESFTDGLEAMQWSAEGRGLAGLSDFRGLPWKMSISAFFEAFVEHVVEKVVSHTGGRLRVGRNNETVIPISWDRVRQATQKSLRPDFVIERDDEVIIIDAKFKSYWYDLNYHSWQNTDIVTQVEHRADLLQVLAYSTCYSTSRLKVCLVYPCAETLYESLCANNEIDRRASVYSGTRKIDVLLTAVPMRGNVDSVAARLSKVLVSAS